MLLFFRDSKALLWNNDSQPLGGCSKSMWIQMIVGLVWKKMHVWGGEGAQHCNKGKTQGLTARAEFWTHTCCCLLPFTLLTVRLSLYISPEKWQSERWRLRQASCRLNLACVFRFDSWSGPQGCSSIVKLLLVLNPPHVTEMEVGPLVLGWSVGRIGQQPWGDLGIHLHPQGSVNSLWDESMGYSCFPALDGEATSYASGLKEAQCYIIYITEKNIPQSENVSVYVFLLDVFYLYLSWASI